MPRIKVTGYLEVSDEEYDEEHPSGLTAAGYESLVGPESGVLLMDLQDIDTEPA